MKFPFCSHFYKVKSYNQDNTVHEKLLHVYGLQVYVNDLETQKILTFNQFEYLLNLFFFADVSHDR